MLPCRRSGWVNISRAIAPWLVAVLLSILADLLVQLIVWGVGQIGIGTPSPAALAAEEDKKYRLEYEESDKKMLDVSLIHGLLNIMLNKMYAGEYQMDFTDTATKFTFHIPLSEIKFHRLVCPYEWTKTGSCG